MRERGAGSLRTKSFQQPRVIRPDHVGGAPRVVSRSDAQTADYTRPIARHTLRVDGAICAFDELARVHEIHDVRPPTIPTAANSTRARQLPTTTRPLLT